MSQVMRIMEPSFLHLLNKCVWSQPNHNIIQQSKGLPILSSWQCSVECKKLQDDVIILLRFCDLPKMKMYPE